MRVPGPYYPITIEPALERVTIAFAGRTIADTTRALSLGEVNYPSVFYIPREDVAMDLLQRTAHVTTCPYKGKASY